MDYKVLVHFKLRVWKKKKEEEMFYLTLNSTYFFILRLYGVRHNYGKGPLR